MRPKLWKVEDATRGRSMWRDMQAAIGPARSVGWEALRVYRPSRPVSDLFKTMNLETLCEGIRRQFALPQRLVD